MIKTPETNPDDPVVGHLYRGIGGAIYVCDSYDSDIGYWMTNVTDASDRRDLSERAIDRTYHHLDRYDVEYAVQHLGLFDYLDPFYVPRSKKPFRLADGRIIATISTSMDYALTADAVRVPIDGTTTIYHG